MILSKYFLFYVLISVSCVVPHPSTFWKNVVQQLNNFRRIRAVDLRISNMQKIYWDENLELLARQKIANFYSVRFYNDHSMTFWIETSEKEEMKRVDEFFSKLTKENAHSEDRVTVSVFNNPFNLAIKEDTIRIGCSQAELRINATNATVMLCTFGPSPISFNDRLYARGPVCSSCPAQTGCEDNLCDEKVKQGLPPASDILGFKMSQKSQITIGIAVILAIFFVVFALLVQYFT